MAHVRYRCLKSVRVGEKRGYEGEALRWFEAYFAVEKTLGRELKERFPRFRIGARETGRSVAERIRQKFKFEGFPIPSMVRLLEEFGIRIIQLATPARIDGLAGYMRDKPIVVVNSELSNDRTRMNAAHELSHHLFEDHVEKGATLSDAQIEKRAFECASHLLIPEDMLKLAFGLKSMVRLVQYKERFGISLAAMIYRAHQSKLVRKQTYERLWREFGRLGWRQDEPGYVPPDRPVRMEAMFDAATANGKLTYRELAQLAGVPEATVRTRVTRAIGGGAEVPNEEGVGTVLNFEEHRRKIPFDEGDT